MRANVSLSQLLHESASRFPDRKALVAERGIWTYRDVQLATLRFAQELQSQGVRRGDRVALLMTNTPEFVFAYFAIATLGATVVPIHALLVSSEIEYILRDANCRMIIVAQSMSTAAQEAAEGAGTEIWIVDDEGLEGVAQPVDTRAAAFCGEDLPEPVLCDPGHEAVVLYTSGTTGKPKGAVLTHQGLLWNAHVVAQDTLFITGDDVALAALPLFHAFGQTAVMNASFRVGATIVLMQRFDEALAFKLMHEHAVTYFAGVPTMFLALLKQAVTQDIPRSLRLAVSGGASINVVALERFEEIFGVPIWEGYGLSETSPVVSFNHMPFG